MCKQIEGCSKRMAQKRKVEVTATVVDDESDRVLFSVFRTAAAGLSSLYSQALNYHKVAFDAGQRQALVSKKPPTPFFFVLLNTVFCGF